MQKTKSHDLSEKSDQDIKNWIDNFERLGKTDEPLYGELVEERARRFGKGLNIDTSLAHLMATAKAGRFTTYGQLAEANAVPWSKARHAMNGAGGHLDQLLDICHARGLPLFPAICVNQEGVRTGKLGPEALRGFAEGARRHGYPVHDEAAFLQKCQEASFAWGERMR